MKLLALGLLLLANSAAAELLPVSTRDDPRIQTVSYTQNQTIRVKTAPGGELTILLDPSERIDTVRLSDNARYQVTFSQARDSLILHTSAVSYSGMTGMDATMQLSTGTRSYSFVLSDTPPGELAAAVLRFTYSRSDRRGPRLAAASEFPQYRLSGNREVRPSAIRDDGAKTFIHWPANAAVPAVFALEHGHEEMVNGFVRGGVFTIDRIHLHLVFRIDQLQAEAVRLTGGATP